MKASASKAKAAAPTAPRRLAQLARRPAVKLRLRMIDAVILGTVGLLVLKLIGLVMTTVVPNPRAPLPGFGRVVAEARRDIEPFDPLTTGSVSTEKKNEPKTEARTEPPQVYEPPSAEAVSPTERALLEKLKARRESLKQRSDALDLREQILKDAENKLESGTAELHEAEEKADLSGAKKADAERSALKNVVTMYEVMKPKDAARVFDRLSLDILVPIVNAMNPRKMSEILAVMSSEQAEKLTVALANRARGVDQPPPPQANALPSSELPALDPGPPTRPSVQ